MTKVERARRHLEELQSALTVFRDSRPYTIRTKQNSERRLVYYVAQVSDPDPAVAAIAGDVLQNLRSALDYLAFQLVVMGLGSVPADPRYIAYPIADSAAEYPALRQRRVKGARSAAIDAIDATRPYRGGDDALWRLHRLNNVDKHRLLITVGTAFRSVNIGPTLRAEFEKAFPERGHTLPDLSIFLRPADRLFPLKAGDELFIDAVDAKPNEKIQFRLDVAFGEPQVMDGEPIIETLRHVTDSVEKLIAGFAPLV